MRRLLFLSLMGCTACGLGCASEPSPRPRVVEREVVVEPAPEPYVEREVVVVDQAPPARVEVVTVSPYRGAVWVRGHWAREGRRRWVWVSGHWY